VHPTCIELQLVAGVLRPLVAMVTAHDHGPARRDKGVNTLAQHQAGVPVDARERLIEQQQTRA